MVYPRIARLFFFINYDTWNLTKNLRRQIDERQTEHTMDLKQQTLLVIHETQQRWFVCSILTVRRQTSAAVELNGIMSRSKMA